jgi:hypothetical protein
MNAGRDNGKALRYKQWKILHSRWSVALHIECSELQLNEVEGTSQQKDSAITA